MLQTKGFSIVEILIAITVVGILAVVALPSFLNYQKDARIAVANSQMMDLREALLGNASLSANGNYIKPGLIRDIRGMPSSLTALISQGSYSSYSQFTKKGWRGPYISARDGWGLDPWGTAFVYSEVGKTLSSCGPDIICGNTDDITVSINPSPGAVASSDPCAVLDTLCWGSGGSTVMRTPRAYTLCSGSCFEIYDCVGGGAATGAVHSVGATSLSNCP